MIRTFHRVSEPNCGEAVAVYVSKFVLSQANSNNRIYKCLRKSLQLFFLFESEQ